VSRIANELKFLRLFENHGFTQMKRRLAIYIDG
jgi:hypothetical protein